jgi:hypothetical protein
MKKLVCFDCTMPFDGDDDLGCFLDEDTVLCKDCCDRRIEQQELDDYMQAMHEAA